MERFLPESVLERLDPLARRGAARLAAWAEDRDPIGGQRKVCHFLYGNLDGS
jgi:hypothetical protein